MSVDIQRAGSTRVQGTACWYDSGIVFRAIASVLDEAAVYLDAPGRVEISLYGVRGQLLAPMRLLEINREGTRVEWGRPSPNGEL